MCSDVPLGGWFSPAKRSAKVEGRSKGDRSKAAKSKQSGGINRQVGELWA